MMELYATKHCCYYYNIYFLCTYICWAWYIVFNFSNHVVKFSTWSFYRAGRGLKLGEAR